MISSERREIIDSGRLTLGYIYFELAAYDRAIDYFFDIDDSHPEYSSALLAAAWSYYKLGRYPNAISVLNKFLEKYPQDENAEEAHFLLGQSYLKAGKYDQAIAEFDFIVQQYPGPEQMTQIISTVRRALLLEEKRIEELKVDLLLLETKLLDTIPLRATNGSSQVLKKEREQIEKQREELAQEISAERQTFQSFTANVLRMRRRLTQKENRKQWRAYADYGKARAIFLKSIRRD